MSRLPLLSIIIPTYNRPDRLRTCLRSLTISDYPKSRFEVIIVDDDSQPPIEPVVREFQEQLNIQTLKQEHAGPAVARNYGASKAAGDNIVFTDDDCELASDYLARLAELVLQHPNAMIGGHTTNAQPGNLCATASQLLIDYLYDYFNQNPERVTLFTSNNMCCSKEVFMSLGGFDVGFRLAGGEDRELSARWQNSGWPMVYASELVVMHSHAMNLGQYLHQHFKYGRGAHRYHELHINEAERPRSTPEPLAFYLNLLSYPWRQATTHPRWLVSLLLGASQAWNVFGYFWETSVGWRIPRKQQS